MVRNCNSHSQGVRRRERRALLAPGGLHAQGGIGRGDGREQERGAQPLRVAGRGGVRQGAAPLGWASP